MAFFPFGEPQTRGAAGLFQTAVDLKLPLSVYEYGDEDLRVKGRRDEGEKRGRYQRVRGGKKWKQERDFVSLRYFSSLPSGPWLDLWGGFRRLSVCVCVCTNEKSM